MSEIRAQIEDLGSQTLALTILIAAFGKNLSRSDPALASAIKAAFDDAANHTETIGFIVKGPPQYFTKAVRVIEEIRTAVFGNQQKPRDIV